MNANEIQQRLNDNGFPCGPVDGDIGPQTNAAVKKFQEAYNNGPWLAVDGVPGPMTQSALSQLPQLSPHFVVNELKSRGNGNCYVRRELLANLETLRARLGNRPLPVIDVYRDPDHNKAVGGASDSMHKFGLAADLDLSLRITVGFCQSLGIFAGIGDQHGYVRHVDNRNNAGANNHTPNATVHNPSRWSYPG